MVLKNKKYVVGIDIGAVSSGISIAHVDRPHLKFTVNTWEGESSKDESIKSEPKQLLTSILYKNNGDIHCGLSNAATKKERIDEGDVYIDKIKQYTLNIDQANEELGEIMEGLTIQKVVTDYLKAFHTLAIECLKKQEDFCNSYNFEQDFRLENLGYCLSCPSSLNGFFAGCFVEAGITEKDNLVFVSEAEATAFHCLSLDRLTSKIVPDQTYFVYDIGHSSFGVSKITADSTENFSKVELVSEELGQGSMVLENSFKDYLIKNKSELNLNESIISSLVETFVKEIKFSFESAQDKEKVNNENIDYQQDKDNSDEDNDEGNDEGNDEDSIEYSDEDSDEDSDESNDEDSDENDNEDGEENCYDQDWPNQNENGNISEDSDFILREHSVEEDKSSDLVEDSPVFSLVDTNGDPINITFEDLEEHVFSPYIDYIVNYIMKVDNDNSNDSNIFLSGKYSSDAHFFNRISSEKKGEFAKFLSHIEDTNIDAVSLGAVSFGLKSKIVQIPLFCDASSNTTSPEPQKSKAKDEDKKVKKFDFIVGIDFGTTFTGCSYANPEDAQFNDLEAIHTIETAWPGEHEIVFGKTPTLLMYDKKMKTKLWGQEAKKNIDRYKDLSLLGNFKLFLSPGAVEAQYGTGNKEIKIMKEDNNYGKPSPVNDTNQTSTMTRYLMKKQIVSKKINAVQVIADYLKEVKKHVIRHIVDETKFNQGKKGLALFLKPNEPKIQFVLTVPAMWTASARETMAQAAIKATIIKKEELDDLLIISEPEAAALFCEEKYSDLVRDPNDPNADSDFIVCDAGGGTVDLVTFRLIRNQANGDSKICQIGNSIGDTCGSTYLDKAFKDYLLQFYKDIGIEVKSTDTSLNPVIDDFVSSIKCNFDPDSSNDKYCEVQLPPERKIIDIPDKPEAKQYSLIKGKTKLKIKHAVIKEKIFDPIIKKILGVIQQQLEQAFKEDAKINAILLVGGFSRNPYVQRRVQDEYNGEYKVVIPAEGVSAISKGAVSYGLKPRLISRKIALRSIGLEVHAPFEKEKEDRHEKIVVDETGIPVYSKNRLEYFISKSDHILGESLDLFYRKVTVNYPKNAVIAIFACDFNEKEDEKNWRYVSKRHTKILEEIIKLPKVEEINEGDPIQFDVGLKMGDIGATVTIECQNKTINKKIKEITNCKETCLKVVRKCNLVVVKNKKPLVEYSLAQNSYMLNSDNNK